MLGVTSARQFCRRGVSVFSTLHAAVPRTNVIHHRQLLTSVASLKSKDNSNGDQKTLKAADEFQLIYKFPFIVQARAVCRLKIYQTAICGLAVPCVGSLAYNGVLSTEAFAATAVIGGFAFAMLYVMGEIFRRTVGHIYYSAEKDTVKVSHLTFWGGRKDILIPLSDLVPITDTSDIPTDIYVHLLRYSQPKSSLFLCLRFGGIIDSEKFSLALGLLRPEEQLKQ